MAAMHPSEIARELSLFSFFSGFPEDVLLTFSTMAQSCQYNAGDLLLTQGNVNECLFFLRSGRLAIEVDDERVSELVNPGEVFGEMSLINRQPITASVRALTTVEVFMVSEAYFKGLPQKDIQLFQQLLYRVYASVLSERLKKTNDKAKRFEATNRDLVSAQARLKIANETLEKEIHRRTEELVHKIQDLTTSHLRPAQTMLFRWVQIVPPVVTSSEIKALFRSISEVVEFLRPLTQPSALTGQNQTKKVLLFDINKKQQVIAKLALGGSGVDLSIASTIEGLESLLQDNQFDLILCDAEVREAVTKIKSLQPQTPTVLLVTTDMRFYLETIRAFPSQPYFVSRSPENRSFTIKNISTTVAKILYQDFFGMDKYLAWGSRILEETARESTERLNLIEKMKVHFCSFGIRPAILDRVHTVAEEMLMNAIYDAPTDSTGRPLFNHISRTEKIVLKESQQARLRFGTDGVLLAVSVEDPFGSLGKSTITNYLESCYAGQAGSLNIGKGGAGRGLHMIIESADLTIFNIAKGHKTEIICLFNLDQNTSEPTPPTFHLFFNEKAK